MQELLGQGRTADVFRYDENRVIKIFHEEFAGLAFQEFQTAKNIESANAPKVYDIIDIDGKKGVVYEHIKGVSMLYLLQKAPLKVFKYAKLLADLHIEIHTRTANELPKLKDSLSAIIKDLKSINQSDKGVILDYLSKLPEGNILCHYDFHPGNILIDSRKAKVIDWMTAHIGDPCADVCRTVLILQSNALPPNISAFEGNLINIFRRTLCRNYINRYTRIAGVAWRDIEQWMLPVAAARLAEGIEPEIPYLNNIISSKLSEMRC
ncbi:MAG: phosphotransferase [Oscillospiraceae bacterium]|nr:phosphotransferase [Oscillospiraceae bacterium]